MRLNPERVGNFPCETPAITAEKWRGDCQGLQWGGQSGRMTEGSGNLVRSSWAAIAGEQYKGCGGH